MDGKSNLFFQKLLVHTSSKIKFTEKKLPLKLFVVLLLRVMHRISLPNLNEECVMFSLFDERISVKDKRKILKVILQENNDEDEELEVPKRIILKPEEVQEFIKREILIELFTTRSLKFFSCFKISSEFLKIDPVEWKNNLEYNNARDIILSIKVVNDIAERNVKLMKDFNQKITKNEEEKQFFLQVRQFSIGTLVKINSKLITLNSSI
jgi:hypothetical protein